MIEARRLAQIGIFLYGLTQIGSFVDLGTALGQYLSPGPDTNHLGVAVAAGYSVFVLSLLFLSRGWSALIAVPGAVSSLRDLARDDLLAVGVALMGLFFLVSGVTGAVASISYWFVAPIQLASGERPPLGGYFDVDAFLRGLIGAGLLLWGTNVVSLVRWARELGRRAA